MDYINELLTVLMDMLHSPAILSSHMRRVGVAIQDCY